MVKILGIANEETLRTIQFALHNADGHLRLYDLQDLPEWNGKINEDLIIENVEEEETSSSPETKPDDKEVEKDG
jgi:hypothetical protein